MKSSSSNDFILCNFTIFWFRLVGTLRDLVQFGVDFGHSHHVQDFTSKFVESLNLASHLMILLLAILIFHFEAIHFVSQVSHVILLLQLLAFHMLHLSQVMHDFTMHVEHFLHLPFKMRPISLPIFFHGFERKYDRTPIDAIKSGILSNVQGLNQENVEEQ